MPDPGRGQRALLPGRAHRLICDETDCGSEHDRPVFFTTKRLDQISTYVWDWADAVLGSGGDADWVPVETTQLITTFPDTNDGSARNLWLDALYTHAWGKYGDSGDELNTYAINFSAEALNNRVDWVVDDDTRRAVARMRIAKVRTEFGGVIDVTYAAHVPDTDPETGIEAENPSGLTICPKTGFADQDAYETWVDGEFPDGWAANDKLCFPLTSEEYAATYHKYVVTELTLSDPVAPIPVDTNDDDIADDGEVLETVYHYGYQGAPAWRYAEDPNKEFGDESLTFSDFAGYGEVWSWVGDEVDYAQTRNTYYRGLSQQPLPNGVIGAKVYVGRGNDPGDRVEDVHELAGTLAYTEYGHYDPAASPDFVAVSKSYTDYEVVNALAGPARDIDTELSNVREIIPVGLADSDEFADFLVWKTDGTALFFPGDGTGGVLDSDGVASPISGLGTPDRILSPGDWDGDGKNDLILVDSSLNFRLHEGNGDGTWDSASTLVGSGWTGAWEFVTPGSWGADAYLDILGVRDDDVWVRSGSGSGVAGSGTVLGEEADDARLLFGDFDGDGQTDAIDHFGEEDEWYVSWGGDSSWTYFNTSTYGPGEDFWVGGDFNGDGDDDLLHWSSSNDWRVMYDHEATSWSNLNGSGVHYNLFFADVNGDSEDDFLWYDEGNERWRVTWSGTGNWSTRFSTPIPYAATYVGDFDKDGSAELVYHHNTNGWMIWNNGDSAYASKNSDTTTGSNLMVGDFNGDGYDDMVRRRAGTWEYSPGLDGTWTPLEAEGGAEGESAVYDYDTDFTYQVWDFDGNGISDIVRYGDGGWMALTDGLGDWQPVVHTRWADYANFEPAGDMDGDGEVDLLAISEAGRVTLLTGQDGVKLPSGGRDDVVTQLDTDEQILAPGDFDGDGVADLIVYDADGNLTLHPGVRRTHGGRGIAESTAIQATGTWSWSAPETAQTVAVETTTTTKYDEYLQVESTTSTVTDLDPSAPSPAPSLTTCTLFDNVWNVANGAETGYFNPEAWGGEHYITATTSVMTLEGGCDPSDTGANDIITGYSETVYDYVDGSSGDLSEFDQAANLTRGVPSLEFVYGDYDDAASVAVNRASASVAYAAYDAFGRIATAYMPNDVTIDGSGDLALGDDFTAWTYGAYADNTDLGWVREVKVTTSVDDADDGDFEADFETSSWLEPTRGNVARSDSINDDYTFYRYDAFGMLIEGYAPSLEYSEASPPWLEETPPIPDVRYEYDIYAPGVAVRTTPVAVMTVAHSGVDSSGDPTCDPAACYVNRSYTFLDGWGRVREQHSVSPGGSGGRLVSATFYNDLGQVAWNVASYFNSTAAQFESGLANPVKGGLDNYTEYEYDWASRVKTQTVDGNAHAAALATVTEFLARGTKVTAPSGSSTTTTNDYLGRLIEQVQIEPSTMGTESITTGYDYFTLAGDGSEKLAGDFPLVGAEGYSGVLVTDADSNETAFVSNLAGQRTHMVDPNSGLSLYTYDAAGQTLQVRSFAEGVDPSIDDPYGTISMTYDDLSRMIERVSEVPDGSGGFDDSSSASWTYDNAVGTSAHVGVLLEESATTVVDAATGLSYTVTSTPGGWDALHRPTEQTVTLPMASELGELSGVSYTTEVAYDGLGRAFELTAPAVADLPAETVTTGYTIFGGAETLTVLDTDNNEAFNLVTNTVLDNYGRLASRSYGNGVTRAITWDDGWQAPSRITANYTIASVDYSLQDDSIGRDEYGRVDSIVDQRGGSALETQCFVYDGINRLSEAWTLDGASSQDCSTGRSSLTLGDWWLSGDGYSAAWTYSDSGRISQVLQGFDAGSGAWADTTRSYTYDDVTTADHPHAVVALADSFSATTAAFTYDDAGRMLVRDFDGTADDQSLTWDAMSNLVALDADGGQWRYVYDASGQRVAKLWLATGGGGRAWGYFGATELNDPDVTTDDDLTGTRYYTHGGASVAVRQGGSMSLLLGDFQGSADVMVPLVHDGGTPGALLPFDDADLGDVTRNSYTPYGAVRGADALSIERGWLNQVADNDTGLTYLNARYYDQALGRFLSPDPLMNPEDPRTLDPYRYADNNPVSFQDASGLWSCPAGPYRQACLDANNNYASGLSGGKPTGSGPASPAPSDPDEDYSNICDTGFECGSAEDDFYDTWYGASLGGLENWTRGFGDSVIGIADLIATGWCSNFNGTVLTERGRDCFSQNGDGGWLLPRIGQNGQKDAEASYWIGAFLNPTLLIGGGTGTGANLTAKGGAAVVSKGRQAETLVEGLLGMAKNTRPVTVNNRIRIPDFMGRNFVGEVKNVQYQAFTRQLRDFVEVADSRGTILHLYVRENTTVSGPLQEAVDAGRVVLERIAGMAG